MTAYVIAECGINHNGDMATAKRMITEAKQSGADAVKFQKRTVDACYSAGFLASPRESPWGHTQRAQKEGLEFTAEQHAELQAHARGLDLDCSWSCWDHEALAEMAALEPAWLKIASPILGDRELLRAHAATGIPLIVSTGMAELKEIRSGLYTLATLSDAPLRAVLHCTSSYPCPDDEINLFGMEELAHELALLPRQSPAIGYSGHERGIATTVAAVALGAEVVERHLTLDRTMYGSDQAASLEPQGFARMVRDIRAVEAAMGDGVLRVQPSEVAVRAKLRRGGP